MATIELSTSHRQRRTGLLNLPCINVYWSPEIGSFFDRPALVDYQTKGSGRIRGMFYEDGLFGGDRFYISGGQLWRESAIVGTVGGEDKARLAGGKDGADDCLVYVANTGLVYKYAAGVITSIAIPDGRLVYDVAYFGNRFIYFTGDGRFYWSDVNAPSTINALNFATAESAFDGFLRAAVAQNRLYIFGSSSIDSFYATGSDDAVEAFAPITADKIDFGAFSSDSVVESDGRIYFISSKRSIYLLAGGLTQIADDSVLEALSTAPMLDISLSTLFIDGKEFFILTDRAADSYVFDGANWYRWRRVKKESLHIIGTITKDGVTYAGDMANGKIYRFDVTTQADSDYHIERVVSGYYPLRSGRERCNVISLQAARGVGRLETETDPQVEMRYSDDGGYEFSDWMPQPLGGVGQYWRNPIWRSLGMMIPTGRVFQFRCAHNVAFCPQSGIMNEGRP